LMTRPSRIIFLCFILKTVVDSDPRYIVGDVGNLFQNALVGN
jgi:hypothetical protein